MRLTRTQVKAWNSRAGNNFELDVQYALMWNEKELHKFINFKDNEVLEVRLRYKERIDADGDKYVFPVIQFQKWYDEGEVLSSSGYGKYTPIGVAVLRRNFTWLLKYSHTKELNDESLIQLYDELMPDV